MIKKVLQYGFADGVSRGSPIIYMPILTLILSISDYGLYALTQAIVVLSVPLLSLNGSASIMREGLEQLEHGRYLLKQYLILVASIGGVVLLSELLFRQLLPGWFIWVTLLAISEAIWFLFLSFFRCSNKEWSYLFICVAKVSLIALVFFCIANFLHNVDVVIFIKTQFLVSLLINSFFWFVFIANIPKVKTSFYLAILFSGALILHSAGQWIMSAADKIVVKYLLGYSGIGKYAIAYNVGLILGVLNAGVGLVLPQLIIQDYNIWLSRRKHLTYIALYGGIAFLLLWIICLCLSLDYKYLHLFHFYYSGFFYYMIFIYNGIVFLGYYYLYSSFLFYWRRGIYIAIASFVVGVINIMLTILLAVVIGLLGAALATFASYILYFIIIGRFACKIEPKLKNRFVEDLLLSGLISLVMMSALLIRWV